MDEDEYIQEFFAFQARTEWVWETYRPEYEGFRQIYDSTMQVAQEAGADIREKLELGIIYEEDIDFSYLDEPAEAFADMLSVVDMIFACLDSLNMKLQKAGENFEGYHPYMVSPSFYDNYTAALVHSFQGIIEDKQFFEEHGYEFHAPNIERLLVKDQINEITEERTWINGLFAEYEQEHQQ